MKVNTYSQARQQLASVLDHASREGVVQIRRRDGRLFVVKPVRSGKSPLDVPGISADVSTAELIEIVREGRERQYRYSRPPNKRMQPTRAPRPMTRVQRRKRQRPRPRG